MLLKINHSNLKKLLFCKKYNQKSVKLLTITQNKLNYNNILS